LDALTLLLNGLSLRAKLAFWGGVCGNWSMDHNSDSAIWFHLLCKGEGWVHAPGWKSHQKLEAGDLVLYLPHAPYHIISYSPDEIPTDFSNLRVTSVNEGQTGFVCGQIELGMPKAALWSALPAEILIRKAQAGEILSLLIQLIIQESDIPRFGSDSIIERLCDSIFVLVLRHCIEHKLVNSGVLLAMQDPRLEIVLNAMHKKPWEPWTVTKLCCESGLSKTVLNEKFTARVGHSPIEYLTHWRMHIASSMLNQSGMNIERVAERCGYQSPAAFSKAFKRTFGVSPGEFRRSRHENHVA
jgi:AraC family transcriptional activator of mtrCDE